MIWGRKKKPQDASGDAEAMSVPAVKPRRKLTQLGLEEPFLIVSRGIAKRCAERFPRFYSRVTQGRYSFELLLERRLWLFLMADVFIIMISLFDILVGGGEPWAYYRQAVIIPFLLIGLPALSSLLSLERQAGSLDLALAVPSTERYFVRRILPVCLCLVVQGWSILILALEDSGDLLRALIQSLAVALLLGVLALFWAVRLRSSGAVLVASLATTLLLSKWIFYNPMIDKSGGPPERLLGVAVPVLDWMWNILVLILATWILFQYARERLRRPETLIA